MKIKRLLNYILQKKKDDINWIEELEYNTVDQSRGDILFFISYYKIPDKYKKKWDGRYIEMPNSDFTILFDKNEEFIGLYHKNQNRFIDGKKINPKQIVRLYI